MKLSTPLLFLTLFFVILLLAGPIFVQANGCDSNNFICIENPLKYETMGELIPAITNFLKNTALAIGGIMIIWSGIQIMIGMTTGEKEAKVIRGKKTLMWTMLGIAIIISVDFIVGFIKELIGG
jgi:hypothetical protein